MSETVGRRPPASICSPAKRSHHHQIELENSFYSSSETFYSDSLHFTLLLLFVWDVLPSDCTWRTNPCLLLPSSICWCCCSCSPRKSLPRCASQILSLVWFAMYLSSKSTIRIPHWWRKGAWGIYNFRYWPQCWWWWWWRSWRRRSGSVGPRLLTRRCADSGHAPRHPPPSAQLFNSASMLPILSDTLFPQIFAH